MRTVCSLRYISNEGFRVHLTEPLPYQHSPPKNHNSALERINILRKNLRKEQDEWRSLVLDDDIRVIWPEVFYSPFGVVNKGDKPPTEAGRTIHDLSYPLSASINALTDASTIIRPTYKHYDMIAKEILTQQATRPGVEIKLQTGDAASAFRNIGVHSHSAHVFGGHIEEEHALVIDLCAAFDWTGSPGTYGVFGDAISHIHGRTANSIHTPGFFNYHWVDDHVNVAPDINANCSEIDRSLRRAMCSVLGADGINEDKFTPWATQHKVLGLIFNTNTKTVSMPDTKIQKARILVAQTFHTASLSRGEYRSLMGSLRHVATCVRPARAFLQRLRQKEHLLNRYSRVTVSNDMRRDLLWWWIILNTNILNDTPMAFFNALPNADITIETDASDSGICAVNRKDRTVLVYQFSRQELSLIQEFNCSNSNGFDINVRELLACAFAIFHWGPSWGNHHRSQPFHVHFKIDNTSAISWQSKMTSHNPRAQTIIRLLSYWEWSWGLRFSASHVAGSDNVTADAGSRLSTSSAHSTLFSSLTSGWIHETPSITAT